MSKYYKFNNFLEAQVSHFNNALKEIQSGLKLTHWMWFIFPQFYGLGNSHMSITYSIKSIEEAKAYFNHDVLGKRLIKITEAFYEINNKSAFEILGTPDDFKLKSCMTLFDAIQDETDLFDKVLNKYFSGDRCQKTIQLLK